MSNIKNLGWSAIERVSTFFVSFTLSVIFARLLTPHDYGLYGLLTIFITLGNVFVDSGFTLALIQKKHRTEEDFSTVFCLNVIIAIFLYAIIFILAKELSLFYNQPILKNLCRILCLILIISSFSNVQKTRLVIGSRFKDIALINLFSIVISGICGIILAVYSWGVWALVLQQVLLNVLSTIFLWLNSDWIPKFIFSLQSLKKMYRFGVNIFLGGILHTAYNNIYPLVIGKLFSASQVGFYTKANSLSFLPSFQITAIFDRTAYPLWCSLQNNKIELKKSFFKHLRAVAFLIFPIMVLCSILSKPIIVLLFSEKWEPASWIMAYLCFSYILFPIMDFNWQILNACGRSDLSLRVEVFNKTLSIIMLIFFSYFFGVKGACYCQILYSLFSVLLSSHYLKKTVGISFIDEFHSLCPIIINCVFMGSVVYLFSRSLAINSFLLVLFSSLLGVVVYILVAVSFKYKEIVYVKQFINKHKGNK